MVNFRDVLRASRHRACRAALRGARDLSADERKLLYFTCTFHCLVPCEHILSECCDYPYAYPPAIFSPFDRLAMVPATSLDTVNRRALLHPARLGHYAALSWTHMDNFRTNDHYESLVETACFVRRQHVVSCTLYQYVDEAQVRVRKVIGLVDIVYGILLQTPIRSLDALGVLGGVVERAFEWAMYFECRLGVARAHEKRQRV